MPFNYQEHGRKCEFFEGSIARQICLRVEAIPSSQIQKRQRGQLLAIFLRFLSPCSQNMAYGAALIYTMPGRFLLRVSYSYMLFVASPNLLVVKENALVFCEMEFGLPRHKPLQLARL